MNTLQEWSSYIATLEGEPLRSKGIAANSLAFVQMLQKEGKFSSSDIGEILKMFVRQYVLTGQEPPEGGYVDASAIIENDDELRRLYWEMISSDTEAEEVTPF